MPVIGQINKEYTEKRMQMKWKALNALMGIIPDKYIPTNLRGAKLLSHYLAGSGKAMQYKIPRKDFESLIDLHETVKKAPYPTDPKVLATEGWEAEILEFIERLKDWTPSTNPKAQPNSMYSQLRVPLASYKNRGINESIGLNTYGNTTTMRKTPLNENETLYTLLDKFDFQTGKSVGNSGRIEKESRDLGNSFFLKLLSGFDKNVFRPYKYFPNVVDIYPNQSYGKEFDIYDTYTKKQR